MVYFISKDFKENPKMKNLLKWHPKSMGQFALLISLFYFINVFDSFGQFRASAVKVNVTPSTPQWLRGYDPRLSDGVHDSIFLKIVGLDDGDKQFFLVSSDFVGYPIQLYDRVAAILKQNYNIENLWWGTTHSHSAPELGPQFKGIPFPHMAARREKANKHEIDTTYTMLLVNKLIKGILEAQKALVPARMGVGWGFSNANINRRAIDENGKASLGLNPDLPTDKRIGLLRIDKLDGRPLALIANYPMHGTVLGPQSLEISGDAPGIVGEYVEEKIGVPMLYINGAAGNMAPIYSVYPSPRAGHLDQFKVLLGDRILDAYKKIPTTTTNLKLTFGALIVETPRMTGLDWPEDLKEYSRTTKEGVNLVRLPIRFLKINEDIAIWSAPVEMFCEIPMEIRSHSPFPYTFYFGYMNGSLGYFPIAEAWKYGGYEPAVSPFTPSAQRDLEESVIGYLKGELNSN